MYSDNTDIITELRGGIVSASADKTEAIASTFAQYIPNNKVLAFYGDLGAGKTTFIKGMAKAWNIKEPVTSPTFNLYTVYEGDRQLVHLDAYRLSKESDLESLMIEDFLNSPWCLAIEWPSRIENQLPNDRWGIYLGINEKKDHTIRLET